MNKIRHYIWIALVLFACNNFICAQEHAIKIDSSHLEVTNFNENIKERYNDSNFNYSVNDTGGVNLIQSIFRKFFGWLSDIFGVDIDVDYKTLELIVYGMLGIGALYLLIRFLLQSPVSSVFKTQEKIIDNFKYVEENLTKIDFDKLIKEAIMANNYRLATRYLYLSSLKALTNKQIITWDFDKTNSDYIQEINDQSVKALFKRISYIYDYVWYGEFPVDKVGFNKHKKEFNQLLIAITNG